jgi:hypothetical protein
MARVGERDTLSNMVKDVEGARGPRGSRGWRGSLLFSALVITGVSNACGGRTVWVEETFDDAGESGDGGSRGGNGGDNGGGGYGGSYGGSYGGDYGGGGYGGSYGGAYGGSYGGNYGGGGYGGTYGGAYGGGAYGGVAGVPTGGVAGVGGSVPIGGTYGGVSGSTGKGGCGAAAGSGGTGGSSGSPGLGKACTMFCSSYPYTSCRSDFEGPLDCLQKCQDGFNLGAWCEYALVEFLYCASQYLDPNAMCSQQGDLCYGPGCTLDAVNACATQYFALLECQDNPRPVPPCPPPPDPPVPPNCVRGTSGGPDSCQQVTECPNAYFSTECYYEYQGDDSWLCDCYLNGNYVNTVGVNGSSRTVCQTASSYCGFP